MTSEPLRQPDVAGYQDVVRRALAEDIGRGDVTSRAIVPQGRAARGALIVRSPCILAGLDVAAEAFRQLDPDITFASCWHDGSACNSGDSVAQVTGGAAALLAGERTALNFLQHLSGIATLTRRFVDAAGSAITVLDTRKTTPGLRALEKYAVRVGGGKNHRDALDRGVLIKDNHIRLAGSVAEAVRRMRTAEPSRPIEVEAESLADLDAALAEGAEIILLDNMPLDEIREAVRRSRGRAAIEISGGVTLERVHVLAGTGAEYVSVGALTHSAPAADISFEIESWTPEV